MKTIRTKKELQGLPPGTYTVTGEAVAELARQTVKTLSKRIAEHTNERTIKTRQYRGKNRDVIRTRHYSEVEHAEGRLLPFARQWGQVGDVFEIAHEYTGLVIGHIKIKLDKQGRISFDSWFIWDDSK